MSNEAFWINGIGKETRVGPAELKNPAYGQVLIKVSQYVRSLFENFLQVAQHLHTYSSLGV